MSFVVTFRAGDWTGGLELCDRVLEAGNANVAKILVKKARKKVLKGVMWTVRRRVGVNVPFDGRMSESRNQMNIIVNERERFGRSGRIYGWRFLLFPI